MLIVYGEEHQLRSVLLRIGELHGEVRVVAVRKGRVTDDLDAQLLRLGDEGIVDALGVHVVVLPDDGDLPGQALVDHVLRGGRAGLRSYQDLPSRLLS